MNKKQVIVVSAGNWEGIQHRPHHFTKRMKRSGWDVYYVEPPVTLIAPLKNKEVTTTWKNWRKGIRKTVEGINIVSLPPVFPFANKNRAINKMNQKIIGKALKKGIPSNGVVTRYLYTFLPNAVDLLQDFRFDKVIYDCVDDHGSFTGLINPDVVGQMEKELMNESYVCFATAQQLLDDRKTWCDNFHLIQNGAELEHFSIVQEKELPIPSDMKQINGPVVGFIGGISDWIDLDIVYQTAKLRGDIQFIFVGPADTNISKFDGMKNVHFLGSKDYEKLPNYIQYFNICLIPFKINKLTKSVNPIKMHEYLAAGKPIISTPLPEVLKYKDVINIVNNPQEFSQTIDSILATEQTKEIIIKRQKIAEMNSWDARWKKALSLIEK